MTREVHSFTPGASIVRLGVLSGLVIGTASLTTAPPVALQARPKPHITIYPLFDMTASAVPVTTFASGGASVVAIISFPEMLEAFYSRLSADQEALGPEIEAALAEKLWDLYAS
jgi:hypothetical protein